MRVLIASDAWRPQINGVVRSLEHMAELAPGFGAEVTFLTPERFCSIALPTYPEIRLAMPAPGQIRRLLEADQADAYPYRDRGATRLGDPAGLPQG